MAAQGSEVKSSLHETTLPIQDRIKNAKYTVEKKCEVGEYTQAKKIIESLKTEGEATHNKELVFISYDLLGDVAKCQKNYSQALQHYIRASDSLAANHFWRNLCNTYIDLLELYRILINRPEALKYGQKAQRIYHTYQLNDSLVLARIYHRIAAVDNEYGPASRADSSIVYSRKALSISRALNNASLMAISYNELGYSFHHKKIIDSAEMYYQKAENIWIKIHSSYAINAMHNKAALYAEFNFKTNQIIPLYLSIVKLVKDNKYDYNLNNVYFSLSDLYEKKRDFKKALFYMERYHEEDVLYVKKIWKSEINEIDEKYHNEKLQQEIKNDEAQLKLSTLTIKQQQSENRQAFMALFATILFLALLFALVYLIWKQNKLLKQKNKEKDVLIQEIHHRVKNNLQFVSSLISLQIHASQSQHDIHLLNDMFKRIKAMSLVHGMLYKNNVETNVDMKIYLTELITLIDELINTKKIPIEFSLNIDSIMLDSQKSIALGIMVSELVSNSIKYAFSPHAEAVIGINLHQKEKHCFFTYYDNGGGMHDAHIDSKGLGMRLIKIFSKQLKGDGRFENKQGLHFRLVFNTDKV